MNLDRNDCKNVEVVEAAVGRVSGTGSLHTVSPGATHRTTCDPMSADTTVDVASLDEYEEAHGLRDR